MLRALRSCLCAVLVGVATVAAAGIAVDPADAAASCVARASMPSQVVMTSRAVVITATLTGSAGCTGTTRDYGATATLRNPSGSLSDAQRWTAFGTGQRIRFTVNVDELGTYTMRAGDVQVYDAGETRVPSSWVNTTVTVRDGARFTGVRRSGRTVRATLRHYVDGGWRASNRTTVVVQQRRATGWHTVYRTRANRAGAVVLRAPARGTYRLVSAGSDTVAGTATTVR